jgi:hypothetical protein
MTWSLLKVALMSGLLGAAMIGTVRKFIKSGWITKPAEIAALRATLTERIAAMDKHDAPRDTRIIALQSLLYFSIVPIILISAEQVAAIVPLINARLQATRTTDSERDALLAFKDRMIRRKFWPKMPES